MARAGVPVGTRRLRADGYVYVKQADGTWKRSGKGVGAKKTGRKVYQKSRKRRGAASGWKDYRA